MQKQRVKETSTREPDCIIDIPYIIINHDAIPVAPSRPGRRTISSTIEILSLYVLRSYDRKACGRPGIELRGEDG